MSTLRTNRIEQTSGALLLSPGKHTLQTHYAEGDGTYIQFHYNALTRLTNYDTSFVLKGTNSTIDARFHIWSAARTNAESHSIYYQINSTSGGWTKLSYSDTNFGDSTIWIADVGDCWHSSTCSTWRTITNSPGDTIYFSIFVISSGPGGNRQVGSVDAIGHPATRHTWSITELGPA